MKKISHAKKQKLLRWQRKIRRKNIRRKRRKLKSNRRIGQHHNIYGRIIVVLPKRMDFENEPQIVLKTLNKIRTALGDRKPFAIDHSRLEYISMEALVLLTAEIESDFAKKINNQKNRRRSKLKAVNKYLPSNEKVCELLQKIGYWEYFSISNKSKKYSGSKTYLKLTSDDRISGQKIGDLIDFFQKKVVFKPASKDKFSDAMLEAAANTVEHAYVGDSFLDSQKKWWLTASLDEADNSSNEISFVFYDQGIGVIKSLFSDNQPAGTTEIRNSKFKRYLKKYIGLFKKTEVDAIELLLNSNLSKYKDERRGNGFQSFLKFINGARAGSLTISTSNFIYNAFEKTSKYFETEIAGTMIVWKMKITDDSNSDIYLRS